MSTEKSAPAWFACASLSSLAIHPEVAEALKAAGLNTIGDIDAFGELHGGLTTIPGIAETDEEEIKVAMNKLLAAGEQAAVSDLWEVDIPGALVGPKFVRAASEAEAIEKYKKPCGITCHVSPAIAVRVDSLPEGEKLWGV